VSIGVIDIPGDRRWAAMSRHPQAGLFSSAPWVAALAATYGFDCRAVVDERAGGLAAALPFVRVADIRGERIVCLPFSDYCDPLATDAAEWQELVAPLLDQGVPISLRCLRNEVPQQDDRFERRGHALWHGVDLERAEDAIWAGLEGSARQNVRKAERNGVQVREGRSLEDVHRFHLMHCHVRKEKYRLLAQPVAFFEQLHAAFVPEDRLTLLLAEVGGQAIAGILLLEWGDTLYYKFNASTDRAFCPNDLLVWESLRLGRRRGLARLDFGLSDPAQAGLVRYKRKFATEERQIALLRFQPADYRPDPRGDAVGRMLSQVTGLFTEPEVPDDVTRRAGDVLYRFFCCERSGAPHGTAGRQG
jgi:CelD/BcsL family acetyltransferase involved in cellulose biosynthesis